MVPSVQSRNISLPLSGDTNIKHSSINILALPPSDPNTNLPTTVLLPFWGGNASTYASVLHHLAQQTPAPPALAISYAGTGSSPAPVPDTPTAHSIPALASNVLAVLRHEAIQDLLPSRKLVVCAHSMSAKVTWEVLRLLETSAPVLEIQVVGVLLLAPAPPRPFALPVEMRMQQIEAYRNSEAAEFVVKNVLTARGLDERVYGEVVKGCVGMSEGAKRGWLEVGMKWDCEEALEGLAKRPPVRVLVGSCDKVESVDRVMTETVEVLRGKRFEVGASVVQGCGHLLPLEAAEETLQELKLLLGFK